MVCHPFGMPLKGFFLLIILMKKDVSELIFWKPTRGGRHIALFDIFVMEPSLKPHPTQYLTNWLKKLKKYDLIYFLAVFNKFISNMYVYLLQMIKNCVLMGDKSRQVLLTP